MTNIIEIKNLHKHFGKLHAVDGISFDVKKGEIFGFLGPNGAGKSTTIRCMMAFIKPNSGGISILGHDMLDDSTEAKKQIGYLPGNVKLYDNWTGWEHIKFFESVRKAPGNAESLIKRLDFDPNRKFKHLSSGNKQKLGLILALMHEPKLIVMDEPTVGLDPLLQNEIYNILLEMRSKGSTVFISSHNLPEVERLCDRAAIIKNGKLVAIENIKDLSNKKIHKIDVKFADKYSVGEFKAMGASNISETSDGLSISVGGDINLALKMIMRHKVLDIDISHGSLEDIFMKFYEREK